MAVCLCILGLFIGQLREMTGSGMGQRGASQTAGRQQVRLEPRGAAARSKPLYVGRTLHQQSYRGAPDMEHCLHYTWSEK